LRRVNCRKVTKGIGMLAHVPAKWTPVRQPEHAPNKESRACFDSTGTKHALAPAKPSARHSNGAPAGGTPRVRPYAHAVHPMHSRAACLADRDEHIARLLKRRARNGLSRRRHSECKRNRDQSDHGSPPGELADETSGPRLSTTAINSFY
jgi:hypothetical protein